MSCNCKRKIAIEEALGSRVAENVVEKSIRTLLKIFYMLCAIILMAVICPIILIIGFYKIFFGNNKIILPRFLSKFLVKN
jgi:hypothetical protein